ncbi:phosphodiesterase/alkaline phosphatase D [Nocardioides flavus (ex Wang et al. 2016)]|uniref:Phosphodiesterase/alkaline phosphatase D n=1 Tax=Nocardioides flavus (ex Wang et al. 2016) TaxID=2058780 RepID=A0ABQ3HQ96_9ACTN|nr:alkaline phosphatase D family protein [Nocardioides flavus (ex Wang et al. 2016)]GHE18817.1 phosphodiesterase/alkaline phosphatase D [Nocardioides flavus (ex Wang et al. 2016)]
MTTTPTFSRRSVLAGGAGAVAVTTAAPGARAAVDHDVFQHGIASGDPLPRRVVLWTRVTPTAAATPGSGRGPRVTVTWEVATDRRFRDVVRRGRVRTGPARDHTVKVDATRLRPDTAYFYRFTCRGETSPVGRTRTAPARNATPAGLRFGVVSCANLQAGWFSAYRHLASRDDLDAVIHLGDYLYEYAPGEYGHGQQNADIRPHVPAREMVTLADYRQRHAQYKSDPDLRALHARHPFIVTWDDHEITNDAWRDGAENHQADEGTYAARRAAAHRAYDEWMPVRMSGTVATGDGTRLFRTLRFGALAELSMLDLRTHRDQQASTPAPSPVPSPAGGADGTITGRAQMDWLKRRLRRGGPQWKLVGNPVMIAPVTFAQLPHDLVDPVNDVTGLLPRDGAPYNVDQWDGYTADRRELFEHIRDQGLRDVVFLTGDIHSGWACDLPYDAATYPLGDSAGVELVCTSVTSNNLKDITGTPPRTSSLAVEAVIQTNNRHVKYLNFDDHGYSVLDVTPERVQMDWYVISDRTDPRARSSWTASWATRSGTNTVQAASAPVGA